MAWSRTAYGQAPWSAGEVSTAALPGWQDVPSDEGTTRFGYLVANAAVPWAFRSWAGAAVTPAYPGGGVSVAPDPARGVMKVWSWWPNTETLQLIRITPDGTRTPVRGGYPLRISDPTRRNLCTNPSVEASTAGYLAVNAQTTLSRIVKPSDRHNLCPNPSAEVNADGWVPRSPTNPAITTVSRASSGWSGGNSIRATAVTGGTGGVVLPIGQVVEALQYTVSLYAFGPTLGLTFNPFIDWLDLNGQYLSTSAGTPIFTGAAWARMSTTATAPAGAKYARPFVTMSGMTAGDTVLLDAALYELGTLQAYFDGDSATAAWDGAADISTSTLPDPTFVAAGTYSLRMTSTNTVTGVSLPGTLPGTGQFTLSFGVAFSTAPSSVDISVAWITATGSGAGTTAISLTADQIGQSVGRGARHVLTFSAPVGAASGSVTLTFNGIVANTTTVDLDAVVVEAGVTDGSFFDGTSFGGNWTGTAHLSSSLLAPVQYIEDGECPLDIPVVYEAYNAAIVGGRMQAEAVTLDSQEQTWLTHPTSADGPILIDLRSVPSREHGIDQGVFWAIDRPRAVVISGPERRAPSGTIGINAISVAERDALMALFRDASPVLVRTPADYHLGTTGTWYSLGTLTEDREGRKAWMDAWLLTAPYYEVDPPDPALVA